MKDTLRIVLFIALSLVVMLGWETWMRQQTSVAPTPTAQVGTQGETAAIDLPPVIRETPATVTEPGGAILAPSPEGQKVIVETDLLRVVFDTVGGDPREVFLKAYPVAIGQPDNPYHSVTAEEARLLLPQSGFRGDSGDSPDHRALYQVEQTEYRLPTGEDQLAVVFSWRGDSGLEVDKIYRFTRGKYQIALSYELRNGGQTLWRGRPYSQFQATHRGASPGIFQPASFNGGAYFSPETKFKKIKFEDMASASFPERMSSGWFSLIEHYFLVGWIPSVGSDIKLYSRELSENRHLFGGYHPILELAAGEIGQFHSVLYVGPKANAILKETAPGLALAVDYGMLTFLSQPLFKLLNWIHKLVGNWGWSIILVTMLIKLVFFRLSATSYRSMANMRKLQPRLVALRERYGDDKQKLNQAMMEMYKTEKVNPLGGCLPVLVQIPVFIALYWVLLESVELRQAPFMFWLKDLSIADPFFVLPLLMGVSMFVQQRLNPAPVDPMQQKVMSVLPFVFTVFFAFFPAGLVLYWVVNNVLSIAQQWYITKKVESSSRPG
ncbi:MAG: membrane protein insertase YidC [Gammaproteobacteria bacterium]|nr:membrane protein insertase YidC [Gammaproteobacteria bacterium]